jgi:hypothetical protein
MIKKFLLLYLIAILFGACGIIQHQPPVDPVCPPKDPTVESFICAKSAELKIQPEDIYNVIFNASVVAVLADVDRKWLCDFSKDLGDWYVKYYPLTFETLINELLRRQKLIDDPDKLLVLNAALNKNLMQYYVDLEIAPYDDMILRKGNNQYQKDLFCDPD